MGSPASRRATNLTLSSITEHSFHGIHFPPRKGRKCNLCVRYNLLPMSRVAHSGGGPTPEKAEVLLETPSNLNTVNSLLSLRIADIWASYKEWGDKGASSPTEPL